MSNVGIDAINLYASRFRTDAIALAEARGKTTDAARNQIMLGDRTVLPPYEDAVTLAVNAAAPLVKDIGPDAIELVVVASESAVDFGKPIASWVHRFCGLRPNCRTMDVTYACYGGAAALRMAQYWLLGQSDPSRKALVISSDFSRSGFLMEYGFDFVGGGCAVAMIVSREPRLLVLDPDRAGFWTTEISDTFRPTAKVEIGDNQLSLYSYLDALDGSFDHFVSRHGPVDYVNDFTKHVYHAPFPGMTLQAHQSLVSRQGKYSKDEMRQSFDARVAPGLGLARRIGSAYGASNFVCLLGLMQASEDLAADDRVSVFAYGSGCQSEFYEARVVAGATDRVRALGLPHRLDEREIVSLAQYESFEKLRYEQIDQPDVTFDFSGKNGTYTRQYEGQRRLVLRRVKTFRREYDWS